MINKEETKRRFGYYPEEIAKFSKFKIVVTCEYCNEDCEKVKSNWQQEQKKRLPKDACKKCAPLKQSEYYILFPDIAEKMVKTHKKNCLEKYGVENYSQTAEARMQLADRHAAMSTQEKEELQQKRKSTCLVKYGMDHPSKLPEVKAKVVATKLERYGVENNSQLPNWSETLKESSQKKYGVDSFAQLDSVKEKKKKTNLEKYGFEHPTQSEEIQNKTKATNLERYGYENPNQNPEIKKKAELTCLEKYGTINPFGNYQIQQKIAITKYKYGSAQTSKQQVYINNLYGGILNYPVEKYHADCYLENEKITCEYDGGGHDLSVKLGNVTQDQFIHLASIRSGIFKRNGIKIMSIISKYDKIPSDEILLNMLEFAKTILKTERSWINFDLDEGLVQWKTGKEIYDFGKLRRLP